MQFEPALLTATLKRRYKRFLADIECPDGRELTIHCPNTGAMTGCAEPGFQVWYSTSDNPKRKYPHTWELAKTNEGEWICVNTHRANELVADAISTHPSPYFIGYDRIEREIRYGEKSRIDLRLSRGESKNPHHLYIEVKSVTLKGERRQGYFPDAVSTRGARQLEEMQGLLAQGHSVMVCYAVLHSGIEQVTSANHIDPNYAAALAAAKQQGLIVLEAHFRLNEEKIEFSHWRT